MSKRYDIVDDSLEDRLRIGETVLWIYGCLLVLAGVGFVIAECAVAEFGTAFVGLVATLSGVGLIVVSSITFRMIRKVTVHANQMQGLKQRIDELELEFDANQNTANRNTASHSTTNQNTMADEHDPIPTKHDDEALEDTTEPGTRFARAIASQDLATCRQLWPTIKNATDSEQTAQVEAAFMALEKQTSASLRDRFAEQFRAENYRAALETGERIVALFPESRMSADFQAIRKRLESMATSCRVPTLPERETAES